MNEVLNWFKLATELNGDPGRIEWKIKKDDYYHKAQRGYKIIEIGSKINHTPEILPIDNPPDPSRAATHRWTEFATLPNGKEITPIRQFFDLDSMHTKMSFKESTPFTSDVTVEMLLDVLRKSIKDSANDASDLLAALNRSYGMEGVNYECGALVAELTSPEKKYPTHYVHGLKFTIDDLMLAKEKIKRKHPRVMPMLLITPSALADILCDQDFDKHIEAYKKKNGIASFSLNPEILTHSVLETICGMHIIKTSYLKKEQAIMLLPFISCKLVTDPEMLLSAKRVDADRFNPDKIVIQGLQYTEVQIKDRDTLLVLKKT